MRWKDTSKEWNRRFAFLPVYVDGWWVWGEHYERRVELEMPTRV